MFGLGSAEKEPLGYVYLKASWRHHCLSKSYEALFYHFWKWSFLITTDSCRTMTLNTPQSLLGTFLKKRESTGGKLQPNHQTWIRLKTYGMSWKNLSEENPRTKQELVDGILKFWRTVDVAKCNKYIDHLKKVIPRVIELNGDATGY